MTLERGDVIADKYEIRGVVGAGNRSVVYRAFDTHSAREVALKQLYVRDETAAKRLEREALVVAKLTHPSVVPVHDFGSVNESPYIVMELVESPTLSHVLQEDGPLGSSRVAHILIAILGGLAEAHSHNVLHRDLKPDNIIIEPPVDAGGVDRVRILDFGVAKILRTSNAGPEPTQLTKEGNVVGTPLYMSPEQARGEKLSPASDLFAVGIMAFEMLTGQHPAGSGAMATAKMLQGPEPIRLPESVDVPARFRMVVEKLLQKDPAKRYNDAFDVLRDFESFVQATIDAAVLAQLIGSLKPKQVPGRRSYVSVMDVDSPAQVQTPAPAASSSDSNRLLRLGVLLIAAFGVGVLVTKLFMAT